MKSMREIIRCGVPHGSVLGPVLLFVYINGLCRMSEFCLPLLHVNDMSSLDTANDTGEMWMFNDNLKNS